MSATTTHSPSFPAPSRTLLQRLLHAIPNIVVFAGLGAVFAVGQRYEWKLPKLSSLTGAVAPDVADWCSEHLVPESACIECQSGLTPAVSTFGFCREHGVAECVIHHPELAQVKGEPQLPKYDTAAAIALLPRPENNSRNTLHTHRIQFASEAAVNKSAIEVDVVDERPMSDRISANGELIFDPTSVAHLSSRVPGTIAVVFKHLGDDVRAGDLLAVVDAAQVGQAKSQFLHAVVQRQLRQTTLNRLKGIAGDGAIPQRTLTEAEAALQEAEIGMISARQSLSNLGFEVPAETVMSTAEELADRLRFLGLPEQAVAQLPAGAKTANLIPIWAPLSGVVVAADLVAGEVVDTTTQLITIANPERLWLLLHVRQESARHVVLGQVVKFQTDDLSTEVQGRVTWISPAVDERTRTVQVRVVIENTGRQLRDKTYGTGQIVLREEPQAIVVPKSAVQSTSDAHFVFVRDQRYFEEGAPKFFHVRQVRIGAADENYVELLAGALPGEVVATSGSATLFAHLLRSELGAGCGHHH